MKRKRNKFCWILSILFSSAFPMYGSIDFGLISFHLISFLLLLFPLYLIRHRLCFVGSMIAIKYECNGSSTKSIDIHILRSLRLYSWQILHLNTEYLQIILFSLFLSIAVNATYHGISYVGGMALLIKVQEIQFFRRKRKVK